MTTRTICRLGLDLRRSSVHTAATFALAALSLCSPVLAQHRQAPPGMFKDLDDGILGQALVIHGKQLFIDDYVTSLVAQGDRGQEVEAGRAV